MKSWTNHPLVQLCLARLYEFWRRPEALFWTYGFPLIMLLVLGLAFRSNEPVPAIVEVTGQNAESVIAELGGNTPGIMLQASKDGKWQRRLQSGKVAAVLSVDSAENRYEVWHEPTRVESVAAKLAIELAIAKRDAPASSSVVARRLEESGTRYIDFLVPGMLAINLMGGGLWGVGFVIVDMRIRKLLKRLLATPMSRWHFMGSIMLMRLLFSVCEITVIFLFAYFVFGVKCRGSMLELIAVMIVGGASFSAIGLLMASRVQTSEAISGLMNLVMLPMWIVGGVFFSNERFPDAIQIILKALPFVALVDAVRGIMMDGTSITSLIPQIAILIAWGALALVIAVRCFRWK
jgi:ABC-2 type transport system permease protein